MSPQDVGRGTGLVARGGAGGSHSRLLAVGPLSEPREGGPAPGPSESHGGLFCGCWCDSQAPPVSRPPGCQGLLPAL